MNKQAVEAAAHIDWTNATDIPQSIREMADIIEREGAWRVPNGQRNKVLRGMPPSIQIAKRRT
jgi:hypothetical protein